jgi:peptidoglycan/LPS O-acetylase OafA/YrhL
VSIGKCKLTTLAVNSSRSIPKSSCDRALVSGLLFRDYRRRGTVNIKRFLIRRGFKIYPSFWALIAATVLYDWHHFGGIPASWKWGLLFVQNYFGALWNHT